MRRDGDRYSACGVERRKMGSRIRGLRRSEQACHESIAKEVSLDGECMRQDIQRTGSTSSNNLLDGREEIRLPKRLGEVVICKAATLSVESLQMGKPPQKRTHAGL